MTSNVVMAFILRYFTEFGSFPEALHKSGWRCRRKKANVRYLISWWVLVFLVTKRGPGVCTARRNKAMRMVQHCIHGIHELNWVDIAGSQIRHLHFQSCIPVYMPAMDKSRRFNYRPQQQPPEAFYTSKCTRADDWSHFVTHDPSVNWPTTHVTHDLRVKPRLHDTTGCQTGCTTGLTTGCIV